MDLFAVHTEEEIVALRRSDWPPSRWYWYDAERDIFVETAPPWAERAAQEGQPAPLI